jgi:hypothetical protein
LDPACHFDADPDPTFHFDGVPDLSLQIKAQKKCSNRLIFHLQIDADPDLDPAYHSNADADPDPAITLMRFRILPFNLMRNRIHNTDDKVGPDEFKNYGWYAAF